MYLSRAGFNEVHVECHGRGGLPGADVQVVYRAHPGNTSTYVLLARQAWEKGSLSGSDRSMEPIQMRVDGRLTSVVLAGRCDVQEWAVRNKATVGARAARSARVRAAADRLGRGATNGSESPGHSLQGSSKASFTAWRHDAGVINGYFAPSVVAIEKNFANRVGIVLDERDSEGGDGERDRHAVFGAGDKTYDGLVGSLGMVRDVNCIEAGKGSLQSTVVSDLFLDRAHF